MDGRKPVVFIGGMEEQDWLARALQQDLNDVADTTLYSQQSARLSAPVLETRLRALDEVDCAVFIVPRAGGSMRDSEDRDALMQLGLMVGRLGPDRTLVVVPADAGPEILPTSLRGLAVAEYEPYRTDGNVRAAIAGAGMLIRDALRGLPPRTTDAPEPDFGPGFERDLRAADSVFAWGMNQSDFLIQHYGLLEEKLKAGAELRTLFVQPDGTAVTLTRLRFAGGVDERHESFRAATSLDRVGTLHDRFPQQVEVRTLDYPFSYGGFLLAGNDAPAAIYTKRYTFRTAGGSRKPKARHEQGRSEWFELVEREVEQMWGEGSPWFRSTDTSSSSAT